MKDDKLAEQSTMFIIAKSNELKKYYSLYQQETDPVIKTGLMSILEHITTAIEHDAKTLRESL